MSWFKLTHQVTMEFRNVRTIHFLKRFIWWWLMHRPLAFFGLMWLTLQIILQIDHPQELIMGWPHTKNCLRSCPSWNICGFGVVLCMNLMNNKPSSIQKTSGALWLAILMKLRRSNVIIHLPVIFWLVRMSSLMNNFFGIHPVIQVPSLLFL